MWHCQMANIPCLRKVQVIIDLLDRTYISISSENHWSPNNVKERHFSASENTTHTHDEKKNLHSYSIFVHSLQLHRLKKN